MLDRYKCIGYDTSDEAIKVKTKVKVNDRG